MRKVISAWKWCFENSKYIKLLAYHMTPSSWLNKMVQSSLGSIDTTEIQMEKYWASVWLCLSQEGLNYAVGKNQPQISEYNIGRFDLSLYVSNRITGRCWFQSCGAWSVTRREKGNFHMSFHWQILSLQVNPPHFYSQVCGQKYKEDRCLENKRAWLNNKNDYHSCSQSFFSTLHRSQRQSRKQGALDVCCFDT